MKSTASVSSNCSINRIPSSGVSSVSTEANASVSMALNEIGSLHPVRYDGFLHVSTSTRCHHLTAAEDQEACGGNASYVSMVRSLHQTDCPFF